MAIQSYPDPQNPSARICLNDQTAWREFRDGRQEDLSEAEQEKWFQRLRAENSRIARRA